MLVLRSRLLLDGLLLPLLAMAQATTERQLEDFAITSYLALLLFP
jgi:hypothetical protein